MSNTHSIERTKSTRESRANKATAVALAAIALGAVGYMTKKNIDSATDKNIARIQMETVNQPQRVVSLGAESTVFGVAKQAVDKGYLNTEVQDASDFLTGELESQMRASGVLKPEEDFDLGKLQPGTRLRVPASWEGIGKPEKQMMVGDTAVTAKWDYDKGQAVVKETDQSGNTVTTIEP